MTPASGRCPVQGQRPSVLGSGWKSPTAWAGLGMTLGSTHHIDTRPVFSSILPGGFNST